MKTNRILPFACLLALLAFFAILHKPGAIDQSLSSSRAAEKKPNDWFFLQRAFPFDRIDKRSRLRAVQQAQAIRSLQKNNTRASWIPIGPTNIGGRITAAAVHPFDPNIIYIGAAAGGVFQSIDGGNTWLAIFDEQPSLSIGALAIDPNNPEIIYVGTGEANGNFDSYAGDGIYK
ncbi:MAG: WD40/YVTN/BNR-like repeat-containing protein, partial [bacterium]